MSLEQTFLKRAPRHLVDTDAWIRPIGSFATQECRVLDISRTGVRLRVVDSASVPDKFMLLFSKHDYGHRAVVRRRNGTELGAEFCWD